MISLQRLSSSAIMMLILLASCAQRQIQSSNQVQLRELSLEIEAGSPQSPLGNIHLAMEAESSELEETKYRNPENNIKPGKKIKAKVSMSALNPIKVKKLISRIKKKGVKSIEKNGFIKYVVKYLFCLLIVLLLVYFTVINNPAIAIMIFLGLFALVAYVGPHVLAIFR